MALPVFLTSHCLWDSPVQLKSQLEVGLFALRMTVGQFCAPWVDDKREASLLQWVVV